MLTTFISRLKVTKNLRLNANWRSAISLMLLAFLIIVLNPITISPKHLYRHENAFSIMIILFVFPLKKPLN